MAEIISREYIPEFIEILDVVERIKMLFIYDKELLASSGGIIQGMSGSPIVQNNKIIGGRTDLSA